MKKPAEKTAGSLIKKTSNIQKKQLKLFIKRYEEEIIVLVVQNFLIPLAAILSTPAALMHPQTQDKELKMQFFN